MQVFVTGGSGFVGRTFIAALVRGGFEVRALARSAQAAATLSKLGAETVSGDLHDADALRRGMTGCEQCFHLAASTEEWASDSHFWHINVEGTKSVIDACRQSGVRRLIHCSTEAALLGSGPMVNLDETRPLARRPPPGYPRTKAVAETLVLAANSSQLETVVVRPRLIWGPGDTNLLPKLAAMVRSGRFIWIDHGRALTSTCHVENVAEGLLRAAAHGQPGAIYHLTDGPPIDVRTFLTALLQTQNLTPGTASIPFALAITVATVCEALWRLLPLPGMPPTTRTAVLLIGQSVTINDTRARRDLGYESHLPRDAALAALRQEDKR